jgi:hypothetical protein
LKASLININKNHEAMKLTKLVLTLLILSLIVSTKAKKEVKKTTWFYRRLEFIAFGIVSVVCYGFYELIKFVAEKECTQQKSKLFVEEIVRYPTNIILQKNK